MSSVRVTELSLIRSLWLTPLALRGTMVRVGGLGSVEDSSTVVVGWVVVLGWF